jgi:nitroreductase
LKKLIYFEGNHFIFNFDVQTLNMTDTNLITALSWRYATKKMNGNQIPQEQLENILEAVRLAPSSFGLAPFTVVVVKDPAVKAALLPHCYNQPQITGSSALLIFAPWKNITVQHVDEYMAEIASTRGIPVEALADFSATLKGKVSNTSAEDLLIWAAKQAYIALGFGLAAAAIEKIDSTPMEGFNPAGVDEVLGLDKKGLTSACILALGYRDAENDYLANATKVRRSKEEFFIQS